MKHDMTTFYLYHNLARGQFARLIGTTTSKILEYEDGAKLKDREKLRICLGIYIFDVCDIIFDNRGPRKKTERDKKIETWFMERFRKEYFRIIKEKKL